MCLGPALHTRFLVANRLFPVALPVFVSVSRSPFGEPRREVVFDWTEKSALWRRKRKKVGTLLRPSNSVRVVPKHHHHEWSCAEKLPQIGLFGPKKELACGQQAQEEPRGSRGVVRRNTTGLAESQLGQAAAQTSHIGMNLGENTAVLGPWACQKALSASAQQPAATFVTGDGRATDRGPERGADAAASGPRWPSARSRPRRSRRVSRGARSSKTVRVALDELHDADASDGTQRW